MDNFSQTKYEDKTNDWTEGKIETLSLFQNKIIFPRIKFSAYFVKSSWNWKCLMEEKKTNKKKSGQVSGFRKHQKLYVSIGKYFYLKELWNTYYTN